MHIYDPTGQLRRRQQERQTFNRAIAFAAATVLAMFTLFYALHTALQGVGR